MRGYIINITTEDNHPMCEVNIDDINVANLSELSKQIRQYQKDNNLPVNCPVIRNGYLLKDSVFQTIDDRYNNPNGEYTVNQNYTYDQSLKIHNHLVSLEKMIEEINQNDPPIKNTNLCLICMQPIINTVGTMETSNTRFGCQHVYHSDCLSRYNIHCCLMCKGTGENASMIVNNYHDTQVLNEEQVKNFIKNLQLIYPPQELKIYSQRYPQEYNNFNDGLMLGLLASNWGMPPVVVVNNNPGYYGGYNDYNQQNMYGGDPNPDSAVGGFQSNNIEMQEINNANNENNENTGGNFGGNRNNSNNSNNSGNFGGEGNNSYDAGSFSGGGGDNSADGGDF